ncbi:MAG: hydroxymethylbilane synthase [Bosea sp.]|jgi:hydroxymethylbilane synthase|nr:hydroxymethylbilane synthase [Bosea sp. (in: a-proteobacteria)]
MAATQLDKLLVLGTRGSPLALAQAHELAARLGEALGRPVSDFPLDVIRTTGDAIQDRALSEAGGKGLFTKEIDAAQLSGRVDIAVHSSKDLPTELPEGLVLAGYLPREDARDALIGIGPLDGLGSLPQGARIGSASLRRQAIVKRARPDCEVMLLRGSVGTRLDKLAAGQFHATLLAIAGLRRLGLAARASAILSTDEMLPAVGQGAIGLVVRHGDEAAQRAVDAVSCAETGLCVTAERAMLKVLDGSCRTPIAGHATISGGVLTLKGLILSPDGSDAAEGKLSGPVADCARMGQELGAMLRARAPSGVYA